MTNVKKIKQRKVKSEQRSGRVSTLDCFIDETAFEYFKEVRKQVRSRYKESILGSTTNAKAVGQEYV